MAEAWKMVDRTEAIVAELHKQRGEWQSALQAMSDDLGRTREEREGAQREVESLRARVRELEVQVQRFQEEGDRSRTEASALQAANAALQSKLDAISSTLGLPVRTPSDVLTYQTAKLQAHSVPAPAAASTASGHTHYGPSAPRPGATLFRPPERTPERAPERATEPRTRRDTRTLTTSERGRMKKWWEQCHKVLDPVTFDAIKRAVTAEGDTGIMRLEVIKPMLTDHPMLFAEISQIMERIGSE